MVKQNCILFVFLATLHYYIVFLDWVCISTCLLSYCFYWYSACRGCYIGSSPNTKVDSSSRSVNWAPVRWQETSSICVGRTLDGWNAVVFGDSKWWEIMRGLLWSSGFVWIKVDLHRYAICIQLDTILLYSTFAFCHQSSFIRTLSSFIHMHLFWYQKFSGLTFHQPRGTTRATFGWRQWFLLGTLEDETTCWSSNKVDQTYNQYNLMIIWYTIWQYVTRIICI